ncbi:hypothetical protein [Taibaiella koreensis]|uniref:hypothetical protein n=1 Tax=Taibaiella koreensis TaxID=1268548 RepID=UPI000E59DC44|nr:hypothetical protein [Taibaiella koreensis]
MAKQSESTNAKNLTHFAALIDVLLTFGATYRPVNPLLALPAMEVQLLKAQEAQELCNQRKSAYSLAVDKQQLNFTDLSRLATHIGNAFKAAGTTAQDQATLESVLRRLKGVRATKPKAPVAPEAGMPVNAKSTISTAQMSYANRIDNFALLIETLRSGGLYQPNEQHLSVAGLEIRLNDMRQSHREVSVALAGLQEARDKRDALLYTPGTGVADVARAAKTYIKSVYGATSAQYKHVTGLHFTSAG